MHLIYCDVVGAIDFQFFDDVLGRSPRERLNGVGRIARAARAHHRRAEDAEVRHFVRHAPSIDDVGLGVVAHARAAVRVRGRAHRAADRSA